MNKKRVCEHRTKTLRRGKRAGAIRCGARVRLAGAPYRLTKLITL